jgi:hypothetical protein
MDLHKYQVINRVQVVGHRSRSHWKVNPAVGRTAGVPKPAVASPVVPYTPVGAYVGATTVSTIGVDAYIGAAIAYVGATTVSTTLGAIAYVGATVSTIGVDVYVGAATA